MAAPTEQVLRNAALYYLSRYAATEAGVRAVLLRRIDRWAREAGNLGTDGDVVSAICAEARQASARIAGSLAATGAVDDQAFAQSRVRSLTRAGKSQRATAAHLAAKGVPPGLIEQAGSRDAEAELAAALIHARRRRVGPFAVTPMDADKLRRAMASLARAGFSGSVAHRALRMSQDEAEALINTLRSAL